MLFGRKIKEKLFWAIPIFQVKEKLGRGRGG